MTDHSMRDELRGGEDEGGGGGGAGGGRGGGGAGLGGGGRREGGGERAGAAVAKMEEKFASRGGERGGAAGEGGGSEGGGRKKKGVMAGKQDDKRRRRIHERKRRGGMGILGEDGDGYQLAMRLENSGVWREWLGPGWYSKVVPHLSSPTMWRALMMNSSAAHLGLRMRVRALLFDKAASCLSSTDSDNEAADPVISPTSIAPSFLQLNADGVYYNLEQDAEDWKRLQAEGSPIVLNLLAKHDRHPVDSSTGSGQEASDAKGQSVNLAQQRHPPQAVQNLPNLVSPKQEGSRPSLSKVKKVEAWDSLDGEKANLDAKKSLEGVGTISKKLRSPKISSKPFQGDSAFTALNREHNLDKIAMAKSPSSVPMSEEPKYSATGTRAVSAETAETVGLWYDKCLEKAIGERMRRVAQRSTRQSLPFREQEAFVRTAEGMAAYIKRSSDRKVKIMSPEVPIADPHSREPTSVSLKVKPEAGTESWSDATFQDFKFLANSVPDNSVSAPKRRFFHSNMAYRGPLDKLDLTAASVHCGADGSQKPQGQRRLDSSVTVDPDLSRSSRSTGHPTLMLDQGAQVLVQKVVAKLVAGAGFDGLKQSSLDMMCELLERHMRKLGFGLRTLVDNYSKLGSQADLLKTFINSTGASLENLMEHVKVAADSGSQGVMPQAAQLGTSVALRGTPNTGSQKRRQVSTHQVQQMASRRAPDTPVPQQQGHQPISEKAAKRRQPSNLGRNKRVEKDKSGGDGKSGSGRPDSSKSAGRDLLSMQVSPRLNPQQSTWHPQPPLVQSPLGSVLNYKQQLSSLQIPSVPP